MFPSIAGERAPGWNDAARAALAGFTQSTTTPDLYRATLEAIAYRFALIFQRTLTAMLATRRRLWRKSISTRQLVHRHSQRRR